MTLSGRIPDTNLSASDVSEKVLEVGLTVYGVTTLISMAVMNIGAALAVVAMGYRTLSVGFPKFWSLKPKFPRILLVTTVFFWISIAVSLVFSKLFPVEIAGQALQPDFLRAFSKLWYFVWPCLLAIALRNLPEERRSRILRVWLYAFGILSVIGVIQYFTGWPKEQPIYRQPGRHHAGLFMGFHLSIASIWIFPFFVSLAAAFQSRASHWKSEGLKLSRPFLLALAALGALELLLGFSRMLWAALPVGLVLWAALSLPRRWILPGVAAIILSCVILWHVPEIHTRITDMLWMKERKLLWEANGELFWRRPWTGVGWFNNEQGVRQVFQEKDPANAASYFVSHAHSNFFQVLGGAGILGVLAWLSWVGALFWISFQARKRSGFAGVFGGAFLSAWFVFQLNGLTQVNFMEGKVLHQVMWGLAWLLAL